MGCNLEEHTPYLEIIFGELARDVPVCAGLVWLLVWLLSCRFWDDGRTDVQHTMRCGLGN